jgi:hypothetical protein
LIKDFVLNFNLWFGIFVFFGLKPVFLQPALPAGSTGDHFGQQPEISEFGKGQR